MAQVSFSQINVENNQELGDTPQVAVVQPAKNAVRPNDTLIVFLDLPGSASTTLREVINTLSAAYWKAPGGVTTALRLAIKLANDRLVDMNRGATGSQRAEGSITCLVASDESVVIAQAGPAVAYARSKNGAFETVMPVDASHVIGASRTVDVSFMNFSPRQGDAFVVTGSGSVASVNERLIEACMAKGDSKMVAGYLNANVKSGKLVGVAVTVDHVGAGAIAATASITVPPEPVAPARTGPAAPPPQQPERDTREQRARPLASDPSLNERASSVQERVDQASRSIQHSLGAFGGQLLPQQTSEALAKANEGGAATQFALWAIVLIFPILIAVIVTIAYIRFNGDQERRQLKDAATAAVQVAEGAKDPDTIKVAWPKALEAIKAYEDKAPDEVQAFAPYKVKASQQLDIANKITRVPVVALSPIDAGQHKIAASPFGVYVVNNSINSGQFYGLTTDRTAVRGKPVPLTLNSTVEGGSLNFVDVTPASTVNNRWRTEGAVVFGRNAIYEFNAGTSQLIPVPSAPFTSVVQAGSGDLYNGTVYVLDIGVGQIWRFPLKNDVLEKPNAYFPVPFKTLQDSIDIGIDGAIYVLQKNGAILKYFQRQPQQFTLTGAPEPARQAVAMAVTGADTTSGSLFILDAAVGSVTEYTKAGAFVRQLRGSSNELVGAQDMAVDVANKAIYVANNEKLYGFRLP